MKKLAQGHVETEMHSTAQVSYQTSHFSLLPNMLSYTLDSSPTRETSLLWHELLEEQKQWFYILQMPQK